MFFFTLPPPLLHLLRHLNRPGVGWTVHNKYFHLYRLLAIACYNSEGPRQ